VSPSQQPRRGLTLGLFGRASDPGGKRYSKPVMHRLSPQLGRLLAVAAAILLSCLAIAVQAAQH
jgi:hypothetical protein